MNSPFASALENATGAPSGTLALLVLGPPGVRYDPPESARHVLVVVAVPDLTRARPWNTVVLPLDDVPRQYEALERRSDRTLRSGTVRLRQLLDGPFVQQHTGDLPDRPEMRAGNMGALAPLFYLAPQGDGRGWHTYSQVRRAPGGLLFVATGGPAGTGEPAAVNGARTGTEVGLPVGRSSARWCVEAARRHRVHALALNNHQCCFQTHRPDQEIEHKFTLPDDVDPWRLANELLAAVCGGLLPGWIGEYRNEFEQWVFDNHLFAIDTPAVERGYVSFIPAADGRWIVKRKWFDRDGPVRREQRWRGVDLPDGVDLAGEVTARFGVTPEWGGSFRRVRYDVNVESLRTGHGYAVMFDRCTLPTDPSSMSGAEVVLVQCEVEYLRSRTVLPVDEEMLMGEFAWLVDAVRRWLGAQGVRTVEDHRSKLTFLRARRGGAQATGTPC